MSENRPAWSNQFDADVLRELRNLGPLSALTRDWAWGGSNGAGMRVAVIDSGVESNHPRLGDAVKGGVIVEYDGRRKENVHIVNEPIPRDLFGHGTACAGIIHALAPEAEIYSVRVLGKDLSGRALQFAGGLRWAIQHGMHILNLSLSTSKQEYYGLFHELADEAYFKNVLLVSAVNNIPAPSYPSLYSSVVSVAAHQGHDPMVYYYNPEPPVEFGAPGIDVEVAWANAGVMTVTGNSFAAPHIAGITALIRSKHPDLTPFQLKTVLYACASNVSSAKGAS